MARITDTSYIKELAQIMETYGLTKIEVENSDGVEVELKRESGSGAVRTVEAQPPQPAAEVAPSTPATAPPVAAAPAAAPNANTKDIISPMVGVFYSAPSPDKDAFVRIGGEVKKGDVLCIIEAMKLMNEVTAEFDCKIIDICAENGDVVEFGQVLFKVE